MNKKRCGQSEAVRLFKRPTSTTRFDAYDQKVSNTDSSSSLLSSLNVKVLINMSLCLFCLACGSSPKLNSLGGQSNVIESKTQSHSPHVQSTPKTNIQPNSEQKTEFEETVPSRLNKTCVQAQTRLYKQAMQSTQEYTQVFMQEMNKLKLHFQGFQLSMRRSQMMIFFGNGLIKRLTMVETIADCLPLYKRYQQDRNHIFKTIEASNTAKSL
ncbi:MAG: hypothetical protein CMH49_07370 [Myxococcales bacterium]|nr:hypothetical protein [Myxococcales bacterium]